jgi:ketosteroid isomerase-like protein
MTEHVNAARVREALEAYAKRDLDAVGDQLAKNIVWHVAGDHALSGDYEGRDAVLDYFRQVQQLTGDSLELEVDEIVANDHFAAVFLHAKGKRQERELEVKMAEAIRFDDDGRWAEYWAMANDQTAVNEFWR